MRFVEEAPGTTRVELEHRKLERYADRAGQMQSIFDSDGGWSRLLAAFAQVAERQ